MKQASLASFSLFQLLKNYNALQVWLRKIWRFKLEKTKVLAEFSKIPIETSYL